MRCALTAFVYRYGPASPCLHGFSNSTQTHIKKGNTRKKKPFFFSCRTWILLAPYVHVWHFRLSSNKTKLKKKNGTAEQMNTNSISLAFDCAFARSVHFGRSTLSRNGRVLMVPQAVILFVSQMQPHWWPSTHTLVRTTPGHFTQQLEARLNLTVLVLRCFFFLSNLLGDNEEAAWNAQHKLAVITNIRSIIFSLFVSINFCFGSMAMTTTIMMMMCWKRTYSM